jgi:transketolase
VKDLELLAAKIRRNVLDICMQRGGYAGQGVALAEVGACLYFDELRDDNQGWFHDAIMCYGAFAEHGSYTMEELRTYNADGTVFNKALSKGNLVSR